MSSIQTIIDNIETFRSSEMIEIFSEDECIEMLHIMADAYDNDIELSEQNDWSDSLYDVMYETIKAEYANNPFFGTVGSTVRTGKVTLPYQMGSLNQLFTQNEISNWISQHNLEEELLVISSKYDGNASEWIFHGNTFMQSFSRGNGIEGADTTRHIKTIADMLTINNSNIVNRINEILGKQSVISLRGELIWSITNFNLIGTDCGYKNPRNAVSGLMNASVSDLDILKQLQYFPFNIDTVNAQLDKVEQLTLLSEAGFNSVRYETCLGKELTTSMLESLIVKFRQESDFELDGVVVEVNNHVLRNQIQPSNNSLNPEYAVKFKIDAKPVKAIVDRVEWNVSKHGYYKPTIIYSPVNIGGVTCTRATGFNAGYISRNRIGKGSIIEVVRKGDVVPNCVNVICGTTAELPDIDASSYYWTENDAGVQVDIVSKELPTEAKILKMVYFAEKLKVAYLGEGSVRKIHEVLGILDTYELIKVQESNWVSAIGSNGSKIYNELQLKLGNIDECVLAAASGCFARGIGERKLKNVLQQTQCGLMDLTAIKLMKLNSVGEITSDLIIDGLDDYADWLNQVDGYVNIVPTFSNDVKKYSGMNIVFTGFRDDNLQWYLEKHGASVKSSVTKNSKVVITPDPKGNSTKLKTARELIAKGMDIKILTVEEFKAIYIAV